MRIARLPLLLCVLAAMCALLAGPARAALVPAGYMASIAYYVGDTPVLIESTPFIPAGAGTSTTFGGCLLNEPTRTACATARVGMGDLGVKSRMTDLHSSAIPAGAESMNAFAMFWDVLNITGQGLVAGNTYHFVPVVSVHGHNSWDRVARPQTIGLGIALFTPDGSSILQNIFPDGTQEHFADTFVLEGVPFQPGVDFNFGMNFGIAARIMAGPDGTENTVVEADFFSSLELVGLKIVDAAGTEIGAYTIDSASGTVYGPNGVLPEPPAGALLIAALAGLGLARRRASASDGRVPRTD